jgi:hypothetical protein
MYADEPMATELVAGIGVSFTHPAIARPKNESIKYLSKILFMVTAALWLMTDQSNTERLTRGPGRDGAQVGGMSIKGNVSLSDVHGLLELHQHTIVRDYCRFPDGFRIRRGHERRRFHR